MDTSGDSPINHAEQHFDRHAETRAARRTERQTEREAWREQRHRIRESRPYGWAGGAFLILLGIIFLLQNMGMLPIANWWALFILIPAYWAFVAAWERYRENGRLTSRAAGSMTAGVLFLLVCLALLVNIQAGIVWPVVLIVGGVALLLTSYLPR